MIRVLVNGAKGKMGQITVAAITADPELTLAGAVDREDNLRTAIQTTQAQVVVDFTRPDTVFQNSQIMIEAGVHPVIGTTGLTDEQIVSLQNQCKEKKLGGLIAPNFSIAVVLMMQFAEQASRYFSAVEIIEMHHPQKLDAPSGTALKTADHIARGHANQTIVTEHGEPINNASRGLRKHGIPIHAVRLPGVIADQQIIFGGPGETLSIHQRTLQREAFMPGVCLACKRVSALKTIVYGLENIL